MVAVGIILPERRMTTVDPMSKDILRWRLVNQRIIAYALTDAVPRFNCRVVWMDKSRDEEHLVYKG